MRLRPRPETDLAPAAWLVERLADFSGPVADLVTDDFPAYARVLHRPDQGRPDDDSPASWAEAARRHGTVLHAEARYDRLVRRDPHHTDGERGDPSGGTLDPITLPALRDVLAAHTTTPRHCWFGQWVGYGSAPSAWDDAPSFRLPGREHWLFRAGLHRVVELATELEHAGTDEHAARGELNLVTSRPGGATSVKEQKQFARTIRSFGGVQSPSLWWPDDRAWVVATDVDLNSTYVGGSAALVAALLADPGLEVLSVTATTSVHDAADTVN